MYIEINERKIRVQVNEMDPIISKHTDAKLRCIEAECLVIGRRNNDEFLALVEQERRNNLFSLDEKEVRQKKWQVKNTSWSYRDGEDKYFHKLILEEVEELNAQSLSIGHLSIKPYDYTETVNDDRLVIETKAFLTEEEHKQLQTMQKAITQKEIKSFSVVRHGISDKPREMRFGVSYWSKHDGGFKHQLMLMDYDPEHKMEHSALIFLWMKELRNKVAQNTAAIDAMANMLVSKGVFTEEDVTQFRKQIDEQEWKNRYELFRVDDVDELL